ncbi:MAG: hypothetical protein U0893_09130 [Chloroflexota bacterium]
MAARALVRVSLACSVVQQAAAREWANWPESWRIFAGGFLMGSLAWVAFEVRRPNVEQLPAEVLFGFLILYFYSAGYLSGRRTGKVGTGSWAGIVGGLAFGVVVCVHMVMMAMEHGVRNTIRAGASDQFAIGWSGVVFFVLLGAVCGALGAKAAIRARRLGH